MLTFDFGKLPTMVLAIAAAGAIAIILIQMVRGEALVCYDGGILAKSCAPPRLPSGAVVAFEGGCPAGWKNYGGAAGRFIAGVGRHSEHDQYGVAVAPLADNETGGHRTHRLTILEGAWHRHEYVHSAGIGRYAPPQQRENISPFELAAYVGMTDLGIDDATYANEPHNNMPPYIALHYCIQEDDRNSR